ncbi:hypothetical protein NQ315_011172 [Exocentrus adspersus]|uniref:Vitellogenin n=1 Tax=Exocentrus adspersus TaxID=1586481 RepID=A0AAV8VXD9_9CUCU|nr:hypothetical protein NQ315_011172 [Exocentrus adspersus]
MLFGFLACSHEYSDIRFDGFISKGNSQHGSEHQKLYLEVKADPILEMPTDIIVPKYSFKKNFEIRILDREEWNNGPPITA